MIDPNLSLQVETPQTGQIINQANDTQMRNAMATEQILKQHYDNLDSREQSRLKSTVAGASQLKSYLDNNDLEGAHNFLMQRKTALQSRIGNGENVDTQETDYALNALRQGNVDQLKNDVNGIIAAGQVYGILDDKSMPSNLREWQAYNAMSPNDQQRYLNMKRSNQTLNLGGSQMVVGPTGQPVASYNVTPKPEDMPEFKSQQSFATETGKKAGEQIIANNNTLSSLDNLEYSISQANALLPKVAATGPILGRIGAAAENPDYANLQGSINSITLQAKDLYNLGSGQGFTDADREFLRKVIAGEYARKETIQAGLQRFSEALQHRREFLQLQNQQYRQQYVNQQQSATPQTNNVNTESTGQKIRVSNGIKNFLIDPSDLSAAQAQGYKQQ